MKDNIYARDTTSFSSEDKSTEQIEQEIEQTRASMSDTLSALGNKLSPGQLMDEVLGYFRSGSGESSEFAANLGRTIKNNPVPVSLVALGLGWLIMAGPESRSERHRVGHSGSYSGTGAYRRYDTETAASETFTPEESRSGLKESMEKLKTAAQESWDKAASAAQAAGERMGQTAHQIREKIGQASHQASEQVEQASHQASEQLGQMAYGAQQKLGEAAGAVRQQTGRLRGAAYRQTERAREGFSHLFQERPIVLGAMGLTAGVILGAALPSTRRENELMGSKRDELLERAEAMGKEQLHKAERVVDTVQEAVREEARQQGLTPELLKDTVKSGLMDQVHQAQQKVERIVEVAKETAKQEAERQNLGAPLTGKSGIAQEEKKQPDFDVSLSGKL